jgi:glycosyltransferase involved in cell wall biosynthesis
VRVVILSSLYPPIGGGGAEKAAALLSEALAARGDEVTVISLHPGKQETVEDRNAVRVYRLPLDNIYWPFDVETRQPSLMRAHWHLRDAWNVAAAKRVGRILDIVKPDVVHSHAIAGFSVAVWNEVKKRKIKLVHTTHDYYLLCLRSDMFPNGENCGGNCLKCRVGTQARRYAAQQLDAVISVSHSVLERHKERDYFQGVHTAVGYNVSAPVERLAEEPTRTAPEVLTFGYIGRVDKHKGIYTLLEATHLLSHPNWRLRVAGSGLTEVVEALKKEYRDPRIEWLGYIKPAMFYSSIDTTVVPSVWADPLPYVSIESLEFGKSLIAARSGGIPEIASLGRVVEIFPPGDPEALAKCMDRALEHVAHWRHGGFAHAETSAKFSADAIVSQHRACYERLTHSESL